MSIFEMPWQLVKNHIRGAGGREIDKFRGLPIEDCIDTNWGSEAWIGSTTRVENPPKDDPNYGCSRVILPDGKEMYLFEAINLNPQAAMGEKHLKKNGTGMVLIKYLDAYKQYGLQCHPTRPWAKEMWNSDYGKEESWYVIGTRDDTEEPAYIYLGFKEGVTVEDWKEHYYKQDINALENLCHKIQVKTGDAYFVGGGCPHALGEGCFVIEVQEPADITLGAYPLARWMPNASKEEQDLYDKKLLGAYVFDGCSYEENLKRWNPPKKLIREGDWGTEKIIIGPEQTSYFSFTELTVNGKAPWLRLGFPQVAIITCGSGRLTYLGGEMQVKKGDEIFLPVSIKNLEIEGDLTAVLCNPEGAME